MEPQRGRARSWSSLRRVFRLVAAALIGIVIAIGGLSVAGRGRLIGLGGTRSALSQELVVEKVREVAQIVSSEMTVRDVVTFENTSYGSTKRALLVVTGKILAGIDLERGTAVRIDHDRRYIEISIPQARVLAVDIVQLRTYDEQRGLWNPFEPADRDAIYGQVRRQLFRSAEEMGIVRRANESAARMLETMFAVNGYTAEVKFDGAPAEFVRDSGQAKGGEN